MAAEIDIRAATQEDGVELLRHLRREEWLEVHAATGEHPSVSVTEGIKAGAYATRIRGHLACIWGVVNMGRGTAGEQIGQGWLLCTPVVDRHPKAFWEACLVVLPMLFDEYDVITNAIDVRHTKALRWASRLGFTIHPSVPWGPKGRPFHPFSVRKKDLVCARQQQLQ